MRTAERCLRHGSAVRSPQSAVRSADYDSSMTTSSLLGAHVSAAGGTPQAPPRAQAIAANALQLFTKQANRWAERACEGGECEAFATALGETEVRATVSHDSYLINLASPDPTLRARSIESFAAELKRCASLGIDYLVSHPGNYMDERARSVGSGDARLIR
jgi:deoxyribonuclease IV